MPPSTPIMNALAGGFSSAASAVAPGGVEGLGSLGSTLMSFSNALAASAPAVGMATQAASQFAGAAQQAVQALMSIPDRIRPFVEAFAPSSVLVFDQAVRDVSAVIGSSLVPIMNAASVVVRQFGDAMLPAFRQLEPVLRQLSTAFTDLAGPLFSNLGGMFGLFVEAVGNVVDVLDLFMPAFSGFMDLLHAGNAIFQGLVTAWMEFGKAVIEGVASFLGLKGGMQTLGDAFRSLARHAVVAAAVLARLASGFGGDAFLRGLKRALGEGQQAGSTVGFAAAQNAKIERAPEWLDRLALAAATASGAPAGESKEDSFRRDLLKAIKDVESGEHAISAVIDVLKEAVVTGLAGVPEGIVAALRLNENPVIRRGRDLADNLEDLRRRVFDDFNPLLPRGGQE